MRNFSLLSRYALSFALVAVLAAGALSFAPPAFADCGTNAGGGNCKEAGEKPADKPAGVPVLLDGWTVLNAVLTGLRVSIVRL